MKRTRHQLAPAMPSQKIINCAVAGVVPDGFLICRLEIVDVQHLAGPGGFGKPTSSAACPARCPRSVRNDYACARSPAPFLQRTKQVDVEPGEKSRPVTHASR